eukprot:jgi/Chrpa1/11784/Chrysochromulina_OHIO_Genome00014237-RA
MGGRFTLCIDHVQSDPFAPPSQCHVRVPLVLAGFPPSTLTPKAAAIIEALETGASALLMDEDTSATNFLMRDARMQALVAADKEPIKPFITRVRGLWGSLGVSTVLVLGGSGDYFDVADTVLMLDEYRCADVTERAKKIAASIAGGPPPEALGPGATFARPPRRCLTGATGVVSGAKLSAQRTSLRMGDAPELELAALEQLVEHSQTRCIAMPLIASLWTSKVEKEAAAAAAKKAEKGTARKGALRWNSLGTLGQPPAAQAQLDLQLQLAEAIRQKQQREGIVVVPWETISFTQTTLAKGAFGTVALAKLNQLGGLPCAVKIADVHSGDGLKEALALLDEGSMKNMSHPN